MFSGILVEMFYPGAPMGHLLDEEGNFFDPTNWQHATMYFWFGVSGLADILTFAARHVVPAGNGFFKICGYYEITSSNSALISYSSLISE